MPTSTNKLSFSALILVFIGALFYCYEYVLRIMPSLMIPHLMHVFGLMAGGTGLLVSVYYMVYSPLQIAVGVLTDYYRPRLTLTWAIFLCAAGCTLSATFSSLWLFATGRILIGIGSAFAYVGALTLANKWLSKKTFTLFAGAVTTMGMIAGWLADHKLIGLGHAFGWKTVFYAAAISGICLLIIFRIAFRINKQAAHTKARKHIAWKRILIGYWNIIRTGQLWLAGLIGGVLFLSLSLFAEAWGPEFIHTYFNIPLAQAADVNSYIFIGWGVGAPLQGLLFYWCRRYRPMLLTQTALASVVSVIILYFMHSTTAMSISLFFFGVFCSAEVLCFTYAAKMVHEVFVGSAIAFINLIVMLSGTIILPIASYVLEKVSAAHTLHTVSGIPNHTVSDYQHAFIVLPALCVVATVMCCFIKQPVDSTKGRLH